MKYRDVIYDKLPSQIPTLPHVFHLPNDLPLNRERMFACNEIRIEIEKVYSETYSASIYMSLLLPLQLNSMRGLIQMLPSIDHINSVITKRMYPPK